MKSVASRAWLLAFLGCVRPPAVDPGPLVPPPVERGAVGDAQELARDLRSTVLESYRALTGGFVEAYLDGLAHDSELVLLDVAPEAAVVGFDAEKCRDRRPFPDQPVEIVSKALEVHVSEDRTVGWTYDEVSYRVFFARKRAAIPLRTTGVYERRGGRWILVLEHVSYGVPDDEALGDAERGYVQAPRALGDFVSDGGVAREVEGIVLSLLEDTGDARTVHVSVDDDALVVGSDPDRESHGKEVAQVATLRALYGYDFRVRATDLRVVSSGSGQAAWAAANVVIEKEGEAGPVALPLRASWLLVRRNGVFQVVQTHASVPVTQADLALRVVGEAVTRAVGGKTY
jgi:hypothetical protein